MLADLPVELLAKILGDLDIFTLTLCRFVSRSFNNLIKSSSLLQYKLELGLAGVESNPTCTIGLSERLDAVRSYRRGWENLTWSSSARWREAIGNISHNRGTFTLGEVIAKDDGDPYLKLRTQRFQPKSTHRRLEERLWSEDRPAAITPVGIDPSQDLLFAMPDEGSGGIRILTLSTFGPYPGVARPTIPIPLAQELSVEMDIYGRNVVAATHLRFTFKFHKLILVYNWMTGLMLTEIFYPCDDFFFLAEELVACYVTGRGPMDFPSHFAIFRIPNKGIATPSEKPLPATIPLCVFYLPYLTSDKNWYLTQGRMNNSYGNCPPPKDPTVPFYSPGRRQLFSLWLLPSRSFWRSPECSLIVPVRTLLNHIPSEPAPVTTTIYWDTWGPRGSRLLSGGVDARQMSLQFGWKIARLGPSDPSAMPPWPSRDVGITVYDFNPLPFHGSLDETWSSEREQGGSETETDGRVRKAITSPSSCPDSAGLEGVQTFLPYRITSAPFELRGRAADPDHYEISLGEDGMIVWTHLTLDYAVLTV